MIRTLRASRPGWLAWSALALSAGTLAVSLSPLASLAQAQPEPAAKQVPEAPPPEPAKPWRGMPTIAEASGYKATSRDVDVRKFLTDLAAASPRAKLIDIGQTLEGRALTMAIIADPPIDLTDARTGRPSLKAAAKSIEKSGKVLVLAIGNIHGGEVDAKEALLALARELALPEKQDVLQHVVVALLPNYNADANERIAKDTRPGQVGPDDGQGQRENAQGLDLNRDFVKLEAPETRALVRAMNILDPAIFIDGHTTNGSFHRYPLTFAIANHPAGDRAVYDYAKDKLIPDLQKRAKAGVPAAGGESTLAAKGFDTFWYGNFENNHTQWRDFAADPRYSTNYAGLRGRIAVLTEAYNYITYQERIEAQHAFIRTIIDHAADNKDTIRDLIKKADEAGAKVPEHRLETGATEKNEGATQDGTTKAADSLALRAKAAPWPDKVTTLGFDESEGAPRDQKKHPTTPKDYEVELWTKWEATLSTQRAWAYVLPAEAPGAPAIAEVFQRHGVTVEELREETQIEVQTLKLSGLSKAKPFQNHEIVSAANAEPRTEWRSLKPGTLIIRGTQKRGVLASYLLEPLASDGLFSWNFFDAAIGAQPGTDADFPVLRVLSPTPLLSTPIVPLTADLESPAPISFERLWSEGAWKDRTAPNLAGSPAGGMQWLEEEDGKDGKASTHWLLRRDNKVWKIEAKTGRATLALDPQGMSDALAKLPTIAEDRSKGLADSWLGKTDKARSVALLDHENDLYAAKLDGSQAVRLTSTPESERGATISPDGQFAAYVKDFNVHVVDVATQRERALTRDGTPGSGDIRNGWLSWVYFEEVFGRRWTSLWWSPDSARLAFLRTDESMVPKFPIVNAVPKGQVLEQERYPQPGQPNPHVTVWTVPASGGAPSECDLSDYDPGHYIVQRVAWWPDAKNVYVAVTNRVQNWADILSFPAAGGKAKKLMRLTTGAWIDNDVLDPVFLDDGSFLLLIDGSGRRHIEKFARDGKRLGALTSGEWDVRTIEGIDRTGKAVLFSAYKDSRIATNLYRAPLEPPAAPPPPATPKPEPTPGESDAKPAAPPDPHEPHEPQEPEITRLTHEPGSHSVSVSPDGAMFIDTWSTIDTPTRVTLRSTADGSPIRVLDTNPVHALLEAKLAPIEHVSIKTKDGVDLPGTVMRPIAFDPTVKHPVWFMTYAGPMAPSVTDSWGGGRTSDQALASEGIIVFRADPRTSLISPKLAWTTYKQMGVQELEDIKACIEWIKAQPGVDPDRIGMSGFSFGGYITGYAMTHCDLFAAGISGAPPTDWRDYDTIYTERYMLTPQENPDGYDKTSVTKAADKLHGELMLVHGMMDDNVHLLNTTRFVKALQDANKQFEMMLYPENRHGVGQSHWRKAEAAFIKRTMKPTPIAEIIDERQAPTPPATTPSESSPAKEPIRGPGTSEPR